MHLIIYYFKKCC